MEISEGIGSALAGLFTGLGAIVAVLIAQYFFRSKVADLKSAISETEGAISHFKENVEARLSQVSGALSELDVTIASLQETAAITQRAIRDSQEEDDEPVGEKVHLDPRARLFRDWYEIADHLEEIASSPNIDGRTRARYGRIDRRNYYDLIDALHRNGLLNGMKDTADEAAELWYSCRRRNEIDEGAAKAMSDFARQIKTIDIP